MLSQTPSGVLLDARTKTKLGVAFSDAEYGDDLFLCRPGFELMPNFISPFGRKSAGMHGYHPDIPGHQALAASDGIDVNLPRDMMEVYQFILEAARRSG